MKSINSMFITGASVIALAACSSSSDEKMTSLKSVTGSLDDVQQMGWVFLTDSSASQGLSTFATFFSIDSQEGVIQQLVSREADNCTMELLGADAPLLEDSLLNDYNSLSAGEVITLTSPSGSYAEMERLEMQNGLGYVSIDTVPYPAPESLTIDIPGDVFGAASVSIDKPAVPAEVSLADGDSVASGATLTWTASDKNDTMIFAYFEDPGNVDLYVECLLVDDGEFALPASVHTDSAALLGREAELTFDGISRLRAVAKRTNNDLLVVSNSAS